MFIIVNYNVINPPNAMLVIIFIRVKQINFTRRGRLSRTLPLISRLPISNMSITVPWKPLAFSPLTLADLVQAWNDSNALKKQWVV